MSEFWHWFVANVPGDSVDDGEVIFELLFPLVLPVGAISGICSLDGDGSPRELWMTISPAHGIAKPTVIKMKADNGSLTGSLRGIQTFSVTGKIKTKELQDQTLLVAVKLFRDSKKEFAAIKMTLDKGPT